MPAWPKSASHSMKLVVEAALQGAAAQKQHASTNGEKKHARAALPAQCAGHTLRLAHQLEELTGLESRMTILGDL